MVVGITRRPRRTARDRAAAQRQVPARHCVVVDDKLCILAAMKGVMQGHLTTVFPRQGHDALDTSAVAAYPPADIAIERIGDLLHMDLRDLRDIHAPQDTQ